VRGLPFLGQAGLSSNAPDGNIIFAAMTRDATRSAKRMEKRLPQAHPLSILQASATITIRAAESNLF